MNLNIINMNQRQVQFQEDNISTNLDESQVNDYNYIIARALRNSKKIMEEDLTLVEILKAYEEVVNQDEKLD